MRGERKPYKCKQGKLKKNTPNSQCLFTYCTEFKKVLGGYSELYLMLKRGETSLESRCSTINKFFFRYWQRKQISETALRESSFNMTTGGGGGGRRGGDEDIETRSSTF